MNLRRSIEVSTKVSVTGCGSQERPKARAAPPRAPPACGLCTPSRRRPPEPGRAAPCRDAGGCAGFRRSEGMAWAGLGLRPAAAADPDVEERAGRQRRQQPRAGEPQRLSHRAGAGPRRRFAQTAPRAKYNASRACGGAHGRKGHSCADPSLPHRQSIASPAPLWRCPEKGRPPRDAEGGPYGGYLAGARSGSPEAPPATAPARCGTRPPGSWARPGSPRWRRG